MTYKSRGRYASSTGLGLLWLLSATACGGGTTAPDGGASDTDAGSPSTTPDGAAETLDGSMPEDCPQAASFLDVSGGSAGADYPSPSLSVRCEADVVVVESNGIPGYEFVAITPNPLEAQDYAWQIPREPTPAATPTAVPLGGPSAVAVNGLPIFGPTEAAMMGRRDPVLDGILDYCNGHTAPGGVYHYHAPPECLFTDYEGNVRLVVAYALDGYPILAPFECTNTECTETRELRSSYRQIEEVYGTTIENAWEAHEYMDGLGDLDECNGRELPTGEYVYYATETFPYFMGCYRGTPLAQAGGGMMLPMCEPGQTTRCCGDGRCGGRETPENCPADCP